MTTLAHDGIGIHYTTHGVKTSEPAVVFLSGAGSDGTLWRAQIEALEPLFFIIAVDHRGFGRSDFPTGPLSADILAGDVKAILDREGIEKAHLVGFSLGGLVAQRFVNNYPGSAAKLVLMNCSLGSGNPDTVLPGSDVVNMFLYAAALTPEDVCKNAVDYNFGPSYEAENPEGYRAFYEYTMKNSEAIPCHLPILVSDEPLIENLSGVGLPVMVILSTEDPVTPPGNGDAFKIHLPSARIEYLEGYHASMLLHPGEVNGLLADFLA